MINYQDECLGNIDVNFKAKVSCVRQDTNPNLLKEFEQLLGIKKVTEFSRLSEAFKKCSVPNYKLIAGRIVFDKDKPVSISSEKDDIKIASLLNIKQSVVDASNDLQKLDAIDRFQEIMQTNYESDSINIEVYTHLGDATHMAYLEYVEIATKRLITISRDYLADKLINSIALSRTNGKYGVNTVKDYVASLGYDSESSLNQLIGLTPTDPVFKLLTRSNQKRLLNKVVYKASELEIAKVVAYNDYILANLEKGNYGVTHEQKEINVYSCTCSVAG